MNKNSRNKHEIKGESGKAGPLPERNTSEKFDNLNGKKGKKNEKEEQRKTKGEKELTSGNFKVTEKGLYYFPIGGSNDELPTPVFISSPIYPEAYLRDVSGKNHSILIRVFDGEIDHLLALPRKMIAKWNELNTLLLDLGQTTPVEPQNQKKLQRFLMLARPDKLHRCVNKAGWHGKQYIFADGTVIGTEIEGESVYPITQICPEGIKLKGTLKEWQDNVVSICIGNSRMIFSLGVAFASSCAYLINEDSGGFNLKGKSSIGKTKCLQVAVSVFGSKDYTRSWKITANALEGTCALYNDALLPLDEFGQSDAKESGEIAYMITQGMGKGRMRSNSTVRKLNTWRVIVLSTGEVGLEEHMQAEGKQTKAGQMVRFADIPAEIPNSFGCFEEIHGEDGGASFANKIDDVCANYYGTAARFFVTELSKDMEDARKYLKSSIADFLADCSKNHNGQVIRVAKRFALVYGALFLAVKYQVLGNYLSEEEAKKAVLKCYNAWLEGRGTVEDLESYNVVEWVIGKIYEYSDSKFLPKNTRDNNKGSSFQQIWGYKDGSYFYILRKAFKDQFCSGQTVNDVAEILFNAGYLFKDSENNLTQNHRIPSHIKTQDRFYTINIDPGKDGK